MAYLSEEYKFIEDDLLDGPHHRNLVPKLVTDLTECAIRTDLVM